eukprot:PITA_09868
MEEGIILGHLLSAKGIRMDPAKIKVIMLFLTPKMHTQVRSFIGCAGYYRRFIENFAKVAHPLFQLLTKDSEFVWSDDCDAAFTKINELVCSALILRGPDWALPFHIHTDASQITICVVLVQQEDKVPYAVYYVSKNLAPIELNYMVTEKEFLAIIYAINKFWHCITGYPTFVHTDHAAIRYIMKKPVTPGCITRWLLLLQEFDITIVDKPGKDNVVADFLSRIEHDGKDTLIEDNFPDEHLFAVSANTSWYADIANYLTTEDDIFEILKVAHDGPYGGHFADKRIGHKVLQMGYYWPSIFHDAQDYVRRCDSCQRMGQPRKADEMPLQPQIVLKLFEKWAIDLVGPFNPPSYQKDYILVCTDYVTKWVEARAITRATEHVVEDFLFEEIFARYGTPREIVSDGESQFTSHMIENLMQKYGVKRRVTTPYHPQVNGQVESTNKVLENILT